MRILMIRHGEPDYEKDSLTEKGWKEAEFLSERLIKENIDYFYVSPLGRAKDTAISTLKKYHAQAEEKDWLREFNAREIWRPDVQDHKKGCWDWLPQDWTSQEEFFERDHWYENERMREGGIGEYHKYVIDGFDQLLEKHGYKREGHLYKVVKPNRDTIALFCHFALECVLAAHLIGVSPMTLWHGCCAAPSSVTIFNTEERRQGIASFRMSTFGDVSHLYANQEPPSFAARFCETYDNMEERHD